MRLVNYAIAVGIAVVAASPFSLPRHEPDPEGRAMHQHYLNSKAFIPGLEKTNSEAYEKYFERRNNRSLIQLSQVVSVRVGHTSGGKECKIAKPTECEDEPVVIVIDLMDVDGNHSSIWTSANDYDKTLPVIGVEPY